MSEEDPRVLGEPRLPRPVTQPRVGEGVEEAGRDALPPLALGLEVQRRDGERVPGLGRTHEDGLHGPSMARAGGRRRWHRHKG